MIIGKTYTGRLSAEIERGVDFAYEMETEEAAERRTKGKKCREIRYEMRPVANIGDGTMSMLRVPVCLE